MAALTNSCVSLVTVFFLSYAAGYALEPECSGHGTFQGGRCVCQPSYIGSECECYTDDLDDPPTYNCTQSNDHSLVCSGRGFCVCGFCLCIIRPNREETVYGRYCECDNYSCETYDGQICGGPNRGNCSCGLCACQSRYAGSDCSLDLHNERV